MSVAVPLWGLPPDYVCSIDDFTKTQTAELICGRSGKNGDKPPGSRDGLELSGRRGASTGRLIPT